MTLTILFARPARAQTSKHPGIIVVLFDGLVLDDLRDASFPALSRLAEHGSIGLMNSAVAGAKTGTAAVLTLALGAMEPAEETDEEAYQASSEIVEGDPAGVVYRRRTGLEPARIPGLETVVHLGIAPLTRRKINGALIGAILRNRGNATAFVVIGNADTDRPGRRAALFAIDELGVANGWVDRSCLLPAPEFPFGVRDNPEALAQCVRVHGGSAVVQFGDGARLEALRIPWHGHDYHKLRTRALANLDRFLALLEGLPPGNAPSAILLVSTHPPASYSGDWNRLTPVVLHSLLGQPGLLTSATTRTPGVISNLDIAPTIISMAGSYPPAGRGGHPATVIPYQDPMARLVKIDRLVHVSAVALVPFLGLLGALAAVVIFGGLAASVYARRALPVLRAIALGLMNAPLAMLAVVPLSPGRASELAIETLGIMVVLAVIQHSIVAIRPSEKPENWRAEEVCRWVAGSTCLAIVLDGMTGQNLIEFSLLSSYQLQGIRFYGIGNEYMGVLVGAAIFFAFTARLSPLAAGAGFIVIAAVLGNPAMGAKAGGWITVAVAFGAAWTILRGMRATWKTAAVWSLAGLAAAFLAALMDRAISGSNASHFGGALRSAGTGGYSILAQIVWRKILMNLRITTHPVTVTAIAGVALVLFLSRTRLRVSGEAVFARHPEWARAFPVAGWGALAAFLFNDSGIVAALFLLGAFLMSGIYFVLSEAGVTKNQSQAR